jgi:hypothetical protein
MEAPSSSRLRLIGSARARAQHGGDEEMTLLPSAFSDLEPFAERWSLATEPERWARRHESSMDEMRALYEAVFGRVEAIYDHIDQHPLDDLPDDARRLLHLMLSFVMVTFPVEVWDDPSIPDVGEVTLDRVGNPTY